MVGVIIWGSFCGELPGMDCTSTLESKKVYSSQSLLLQETPLRQEIEAQISHYIHIIT